MTDRLMADLSAGKLDAVIAALPLDVDGIQTRPLFADRIFMAVAENGDNVLMSPLTEHEVNVDRLLLLEEALPARSGTRGLQQRQAKPRQFRRDIHGDPCCRWYRTTWA